MGGFSANGMFMSDDVKRPAGRGAGAPEGREFRERAERFREREDKLRRIEEMRLGKRAPREDGETSPTKGMDSEPVSPVKQEEQRQSTVPKPGANLFDPFKPPVVGEFTAGLARLNIAEKVEKPVGSPSLGSATAAAAAAALNATKQPIQPMQQQQQLKQQQQQQAQAQAQPASAKRPAPPGLMLPNLQLQFTPVKWVYTDPRGELQGKMILFVCCHVYLRYSNASILF